MDVYLVPVGPDGYELYCEPQEAAPAEVAGGRWRRKASDVFRKVLDYLDQERHRRAARRAARHRGTPLQRIRNRMVAWLAERVAEQRLLWQLRRQERATAHYPDDIDAAEAEAIVRRSLRRDGARHGRWALVNLAGYIVALPFSFVPGPNVFTYYFVFRAVGHALSWSGARHGLSAVRWACASCPPLTELRRIGSLPRTERAALAHAVAERLGLERLDTFAERIALSAP